MALNIGWYNERSGTKMYSALSHFFIQLSDNPCYRGNEFGKLRPLLCDYLIVGL